MATPSDPLSRRRFLTFAGGVPVALAGASGLGGCATGDDVHAPDQAHLAHGEDARYWRALADVKAFGGGAGALPAALEEFEGKDVTLTGFARRTPKSQTLILSQKAVGCPACAAQPLWPAVELKLFDPKQTLGSGPIEVRGKLALNRAGDRLPALLERAVVLRA